VDEVYDFGQSQVEVASDEELEGVESDDETFRPNYYYQHQLDSVNNELASAGVPE
jgi:hypothetical protein